MASMADMGPGVGGAQLNHHTTSKASTEERPLIYDHRSFASSVYSDSVRYPERSVNSLNHDGIPEISQVEYKAQQSKQANVQRLWNPIWLTKTTLLIFTATFLLLLATVIGLYIVSSTRNGLVTQSEVYRYSWTYGPTAVFVFVASMWMRVDYWCKALVPFQRMRETSTPSRQSILQDYLSPMNILSLFNSIKNRDFAVTLTISGAVLLQLTTVISTSLLVLESRQISYRATVPKTQTFVSAKPTNLTSPGGLSASRYLGIGTGRNPYPSTTSSNLTVENFFQNDTSMSNVSYTANVAGMSTSLDCQVLDLDNKTFEVNIPWASILAPGYAINVTTPDCTILGVPIGYGVDHDEPVTDITTSFQGWWGNFTCNTGTLNYETPPLPNGDGIYPPLTPGFDDHRLIYTVSNVQWTPVDDNVTQRHTWVQEYTAVMCKPLYSIDDYTVTYSPQQQDLTNPLSAVEPFTAVKQPGTSRQMNGLSSDDLTPLLWNVVSEAALFDSNQRGEVALVTSSSGYVRPDDKFTIIVASINGGQSTEALLNQSALLDALPKAFSGIMAQTFQDHFTTAANDVVPATSVIAENRLVMKILPAALVIAFLTLAMSASVALVFIRPVDTVPLDPQTVSSKAKLLASSYKLSRSLQVFHGPRMEFLHHALSNNTYRTDLVPNNHAMDFVIAPGVDERTTSAFRNKEDSHGWWKPMTSHWWYIIYSVIYAVALIVALEVVQRISDSEDGFVNFQHWGSEHALITAIPAAVLAGILLTYAAIDFNTRLIAPYAALKRQPISHERGLDAALLGKPSLHALYLSIRHWLPIPIFSTFAVVVGSFLTIIVSGLYYVENVPLTTTAQIRQVDAFNYTLSDLTNSDNLAGVSTNLIYYHNSSYPYGTYNNLVFATFDLDNSTTTNQGAVEMTVQVPATRPRLDCMSIAPEDIAYEKTFFDNLSADESSGTPPSTNYSSFVTLPCYSNTDGTGPVVDCKFSWSALLGLNIGEEDQLIGNVWPYDYFDSTDLCAAHPPGNETYAGDLSNTPLFPLANGCPTVGYAIGTTSTKRVDNDTVAQDNAVIYGYLCFQHLDELQVDLTLDLPGLSINATKPPLTLENTVREINTTYGNYTGPVYVNSIYTLEYAMRPTPTDPTIGPYLQGIQQGKPQLDLKGSLNPDGLARIMTEVNNLYATYMAQAINFNFRYNLTSSVQKRDATDQPVFTGQITDPNRQRLKQQAQLKITLQAMLGAMVLCVLVVYIFGTHRPILPYDPCSIAGTMVLLAGSEMSTRKLVPAGSEWDNGKHQNSLWHGWFFSMGWWGTRENPRYGIDVGKAERSIDDLPKSMTPSISHPSMYSDQVGGGGGGGITPPFETFVQSNPHKPYNVTKTAAVEETIELQHRNPSKPGLEADLGDGPWPTDHHQHQHQHHQQQHQSLNSDTESSYFDITNRRESLANGWYAWSTGRDRPA